MDNLHEAYLGVYEATAMAKRGYNEAPIRQQIAKSTGGGEAADRASALEKKSTFGDASKTQQRQRYARAQRGDFRNTTSSNPGLHGYGHKSDDPAVKAKQAARAAQRGVLTPKEREQFNREEFDLFDYLLEYLVAEGYADTNQNAIAIMANMSEEWKENIIEAAKDQSDKQLDRAMKTTYKAQNTIDNQHQGRMGRGFDSLPASEKQAKTDRMNARLKARRSDVSGEQNRRSDEKTEKLKKLLGL